MTKEDMKAICKATRAHENYRYHLTGCKSLIELAPTHPSAYSHLRVIINNGITTLHGVWNGVSNSDKNKLLANLASSLKITIPNNERF